MESEAKFELILEIPSVKISKIQQGKSSVLQKGTLCLYRQFSSNLTLISMGEFKYALADGLPIMVNEGMEKKKRYALPSENCTYGISFNEEVSEDLVEIFEYYLQQNANLCVATPGGPGEEDEEKEVNDKNKSTSQKIANFIYKGSDSLKVGLIKTGNFVSKKLVAGGEYIKSKIKTNEEPKKISQDTQNKIALAKTTSNAVLVFTKTQLEAMIALSKTVAEGLAKNAESSETCKKIKSHKNYEDVKSVGIASVHAVASIYDGLYEALYTMARGTKEATGNVVEHKYGKEAGAAVKNGLDAVGNVGYLARAVNDVAVKEVAKSTETKKNK